MSETATATRFTVSRRKKNLKITKRISDAARNMPGSMTSSTRISRCRLPIFGLSADSLFCGTAEVGESDSDTAFANALSAGVDAKLYKYDGLFHDFQLLPFLPESKDVFRKLESILK